ncbi:hypothetical protein BC936DRAFT_148139 [Jimgerdemannia flammicorona]|uniref:Uncharacterized protein n=2 Tax=Jimgerdemannia flammicorona TaxID=994334 RepID=A0A433QW28_9FUNG|nr:hypothetical protein BC936DRAFT_148139 [Jimgerdemannia flammicorona]RUS34013.1 hypothetical protein BC938DRAFT_482829 [Jimgerdemannia flammicorona]
MSNLRILVCDPAFMATIITLVFALLVFSQPSYAANPVTFCKCTCGANSSILELPANETKPCALCNKQYCLEKVVNGTCEGIRDSTCPSTDFKSACFGVCPLVGDRDRESLLVEIWVLRLRRVLAGLP